MFPFVHLNDETSTIEQFRTLHRNLHRTEQYFVNTEALDEDDGRKRKISANWRQKQQQVHTNKLQDNVSWPQATGSRTQVDFDAFDYSTSSNAFQEPCTAECNGAQQTAEDVAKQVASMGFHCASMWHPMVGSAPHYMTW